MHSDTPLGLNLTRYLALLLHQVLWKHILHDSTLSCHPLQTGVSTQSLAPIILGTCRVFILWFSSRIPHRNVWQFIFPSSQRKTWNGPVYVHTPTQYCKRYLWIICLCGRKIDFFFFPGKWWLCWVYPLQAWWRFTAFAPLRVQEAPVGGRASSGRLQAHWR